jgi:dTDP-4-amino-4,6-dideoxygalactose transaminase
MNSTRILANDFHRQWNDVRDDAMAVFERVGSSGWYILGQEVSSFETALAKYWGLDHAVGVASGLDALEIGLRLLGCMPGDKVLTTPISAFATTLAIARLGAIPVFADCEDSGLISLDECDRILAAQSDIRFMVPVHLYGHPLNLDHLEALRSRYALQIVEDCAQSIGAAWRGRATGTVGQVAATSFYPTKNLGAMGDGGALLTNEPELASKARELRDYGQSSKYVHTSIGYNSRLDELQAALLHRVALPRLESWLQRRRAIAEIYRAKFGEDVEGSAWHLYPVFVSNKTAFIQHLRDNGIATGEHYPLAIPDQPALAGLPCPGLENARRLCSSQVSLPIHPYLTDDEARHVRDVVSQWAG